MKRIDPITDEALQRIDSGGERFLSRWSRLKRASRDAPPAAKERDDSSHRPEEGAPASGDATTKDTAVSAPPKATERDEVIASLPPVDSLTIDSDYSAFFQPKVPESLRRAAVKKLFADPRFNVMDGLDTYIDDYTKSDPIPEAMLRSLNHARGFFAPVADPLEAHARDMAEQVQAQTTAPVPGAQPIAQENAAARTDSAVPAASGNASVDPQAGSAEAGADRTTEAASDAAEAANDTGSPPSRGRHLEPSPTAVDPAPPTSERK